MSAEAIDPVSAGGAAYVDDRLDEARELWEGAFRDLRDAGQPAAAARVAALLAELHWGGLGHPSIGRGWLERARRLLDDSGPCVEAGYWELARLACDRPDPVDVEHSARRALAIAVEFGDHGLHTRALADLGFSLVSQGQLATGFAHLDEALAAITSGELHDPFAVSTTCCALLSACDRAGDLERATEWLQVVRELVLAPAGGRPRMLGAHCQVALGGVMCAVGAWSDAEAAVRTAVDRATGATASQRTQAAARLAELHIQRGRIEEAAQLLGPIEDDIAAAGALAQLHFARGDAAVALAVLQRATATLGGDVLRSADLLLLTVETALACDSTAEADQAVARLHTIAAHADAEFVHGIADLAQGLLDASHSRTEQAITGLESARARFGRTQRPLLDARACLALADITTSSAEAIAAARAAHAVAVRLDAPAIRDRSAAVLRRHGASTPRSTAPGVLPELTPRESEILDGIRRGDSNTQIAARLYLAPKTVEHHVSRILTKLGVRTRTEAAAVAARTDPRN
ncbi:LuxR C-terminal-related transcriptional regulator [Kribbella sp. NPDC051586]|uniref:LuxR C-terminal-related transcriptional regulator n=1 Tax=Kribbella sp. NPDC051586 TaxID=3364118 RepID=UPI0037A5611E